MEDSALFDAATADLLVKIGWHLASAVLALAVGVISTLLWGRGGRKRLVENNKSLSKRLDALETRASMPAINQIVNFNAGANTHDNERQLRNAIEAKTTQNLKETIRSLRQHPLSEGHTYATLPDGTNIVSMADGSYRLAIPILLSASFQGDLDGTLSAGVELGPPPEGDNE